MSDVITPAVTAVAAAKADRWTPLGTEEVAAIAKNARPAVSPCLCGCGGSTKGRFVPGHDATLKETLKVTAASGTPAAQRHATAALETFGWAV